MDATGVIRVGDESAVGEVRRRASTVAATLGLDEQAVGRVAIVATEIARNLVAHAHGGELVLARVSVDQAAGVELIAIDRGPGIGDVGRAMRDGFSTAGTAGQGLGASARLADQFDLYSQAGAGTVVFARVLARSPGALLVDHGGISSPREGETHDGDAWGLAAEDRTPTLIVADGLGHGPDAAIPASRAVATVARGAGRDPVQLLGDCHTALAGSRGAAVAIVQLVDETLTHVGVGNVAGRLFDGERSTGLASMNGVVGVGPSLHIRATKHAMPPGALVILHSDGISTGWRMDRYPGLVARHPSVIAGVLWRDARRPHDDATVVAMRHAPRLPS